MKTSNNTSLVKAHTTYLIKLKGYSELTAKEYEKDIVKFVHWYREYSENARWSTVTREVVDAYIVHMSDNMLKAATINRRLASLSSIYRFFQRQGLTTENPLKYESRQKVGESEPNVINSADLKSAIENADEQTALALTILYETGVRAQELLDIRTTDIDYEQCQIHINGKGNKQRTVFILPQTVDMIAHWMKGGSGRLFTYQDTRDLRRVVFEALRPFSQARQLSPHAIRHTFATEMTSKGMPTSVLGKLLGHKNIKTTQKYVNMNCVNTQGLYLQFQN